MYGGFVNRGLMNLLTSFVLLVSSMFCASSYGAEFSTYVDETGDPTTKISGTINQGDFERFAVYLDSNPAALMFYFLKGVYLESPGGDVREALKFANFIENSYVNTLVEAKETCSSSCFLIFSAGTRRVLKGGSGNNGAKIGVHRISLDNDDLSIKRNESVVKPASDKVETYLKKVGMPRKIIDAMNETSSSSIHWVNFDWLLKEKVLSSFEFRASFLDIASKKCGIDPIELAIKSNNIPSDLSVQRRKWIGCINDVAFVNQKSVINKMSVYISDVAKKSKRQ
jgi:hypothetical protein